MTTIVSMATSASQTQDFNEYINTLIRENERLKFVNEKLYKKTLNQSRKILRLKKKLSSELESTQNPPIKIVDDESENENVNEPDNIDDNVWEDVNDVIDSFYTN